MSKSFNISKIGKIIGIIVIIITFLVTLILKIGGLVTGGTIMLIGKIVSDKKNSSRDQNE